ARPRNPWLPRIKAQLVAFGCDPQSTVSDYFSYGPHRPILDYRNFTGDYASRAIYRPHGLQE
ncbi:MAG: hypothetical protein WBW67_14560, partial [Pseudolabrys sp.]